MHRRLTAAHRGVKLAVADTLLQLHRAGEVDVLEAQFRLNSVWTGAWTTLLICIPGLVYALSGGGRSNRTVFVVAWGIALLGGLSMFVLPWRRIIDSRWRELGFLVWSILDLALIAVAAISDGGPQSPVMWLFFAPMVFAGGSYPTWSVKLISAVALSTYAILAIIYGEPTGRSVFVLGGLGCAALISWWQARNQDARRRQLDLASVTDPLTGCMNRRGLDAAAAAELGRVARFGIPLALMVIDLDDFKGYNDTNGHVAGDELLSWFAARIATTLRATDVLARIGGDEFVVLVSGADAMSAQPLAARIREVCQPRAPHCMGIASAPDDGDDFDSLYREADRRLYDAKRSRRRLTPVPDSAVTPSR